MAHTCTRAQCFFLTAALLYASGNPPEPTRAGQIQAMRTAKAAHLKPEQLPTLHRGVRYVEERQLYSRVTSPTRDLRVRFDGPGAGFAAGPEYTRRGLFGGRGVFRTSAVGTTRAFYLVDMAFGLPNLVGSRLSLEFTTLRLWSPYVDYYGPGPDSLKSGRTAYSLENTGFETRAGFQLTRQISAGGLTRFLLFNAGPSRNSRYASTELVYSPSQTPGLDQQTDFINPGVFLDFNRLRYPRGRRNGTRLLAEYSSFFDRGSGAFSFGRVDLDFRRFFALLRGQSEIALRAKTVLSSPFGSGAVPFYLQPYLGGAYYLRGFRTRRFYDNNAFLLNAEYRWEIADQTDAALFTDAGKVFHTVGQIRPFQNLQTSYGFGLRFRKGSDLSWRLDVAFSREGPQYWLMFGDLF